MLAVVYKVMRIDAVVGINGHKERAVNDGNFYLPQETVQHEGVILAA